MVSFDHSWLGAHQLLLVNVPDEYRGIGYILQIYIRDNIVLGKFLIQNFYAVRPVVPIAPHNENRNC